jgi:hypothetical protein
MHADSPHPSSFICTSNGQWMVDMVQDIVHCSALHHRGRLALTLTNSIKEINKCLNVK